MLSTIVNGSQLNLYPALTKDSKGKIMSYQQLFTLSSPLASDDQEDDLFDSIQNQNLPNKINSEIFPCNNELKKDLTGLNPLCQNENGLQTGNGNNRFLDSYKSLIKQGYIKLKKNQ